MASELGASTPPPGRSPESDLDGLLEEYTERLRRGEHPTIDEYAEKHPGLAPEIRTLFPTMEAMEELVSPATSARAIPERVGDFRIVREAGRGGMGVVYEAVQESLGRRVALKVLPRELVRDAKGLERFRREARAAARLHHTNIVPVFGVGEEDGVHYYAMQFIEGRSLDTILDEARVARREGPQRFPHLAGSSKEIPASARDGSGSSGASSPERRHHRAAAAVGLQVADALAYAHAQGILHRDIKPSNLLLDAAGTVWIADFGLAKDDDSDSLSRSGALTQAGDIVGTIAYLAPERLEGKSDARSDVYALGLTLYELITLEPAFHDENRRRLLRRVAEESPASPRQIDPAIPRDLETIVLTATAKEPSRRYASAARLADDLRSFLAGRPIAARRASSVERLGRWCRREPALAALAALVIVLLVTIASLSSYGYWRLRDLLGVASANLERAKSAEQNERNELRLSYLTQARASRSKAQPGHRYDCLDAVRRAMALGPSADEIRALRDEAIAALSLTDFRVTRRWRKDARLSFAMASSLEIFAVADANDSEIIVRRSADGSEVGRLPVEGAAYGSMRFSPDGRFLVVRLEDGHEGLALFEVASREPIHTSSVATTAVGIAFDSRSKTFAFASYKGEVGLIDLAERREVAHHEPRTGYSTIAFDPSGERIALASGGDARIQIVEARTGRDVSFIDDDRVHFTLAWSADGDLMAAARDDGSVRLWELRGGPPRVRWEMEKVRGRVVETFLNQRGSLLAAYSWDPLFRLWDTASGTPLLVSDAYPLCITSDGRRMALYHGSFEVELADVAESETCRMIGPPPQVRGHVFRQNVSPDGRLLAISRADGVVLFDLEKRNYLPLLPIDGGKSAVFSNDGRSLVTAGKAGLQRWPIVHDATEEDRDAPAEDPRGARTRERAVHIGFPETIEKLRGDSARWISQSADGKTLAIIGRRDRGEVLVLRTDGAPNRTTVLGPHANVDRISLRPDGRRLASGTWLGTNVIVWNTETAEAERVFAIRDNAFVEYSPDGRWLAVMTPEACLLLDAATLEVSHRIEKPARGGFTGCAAFPRDGKMLAISYGPSSILLLDPAAGTRLATLEAPTPVMGGLVFQPDGSHLYAGSVNGSIQDWDLVLLRGELGELGLDWADPAR